MTTWYINVGLRVDEPISEDLPFEISERLADLAAIMSVARELDSGSIALTVEAESIMEAITVSRDAALKAFDDFRVAPTITSVTVQTEEEFEEELNAPIYPQVVSFAEIARMTGVSRQRVRQLAEKADFPSPVIKTGLGPLYSLHAVNHWLEARGTSNRPSYASTS